MIICFSCLNVVLAASHIESNHIEISQVSQAEQKASKLLKDSFSVKEALDIGENSFALYPTFDNPQLALENIQKQASNVLKLLNQEYDIGKLSDENWMNYYDAMYNMMDLSNCPEWYNESYIEFRMLRNFFDIYENEFKNVELKEIAMKSENPDILLSNEDFLLALPYTNMKVQELSRHYIPLSVGFSIEDGITYATDHATSPNKSDYAYFSSDCTNFASQILEAGGVEQEVYSSESKGWWHTKGLLGHKHSISWIRADTFANYMGIGYETEDNADFSENIKKGDFIAADFENDGDWNHMGFVTDVADFKSNGYYNYKVAQHTSNYHAWTNSPTNGWENIGSDGGCYARVRR